MSAVNKHKELSLLEELHAAYELLIPAMRLALDQLRDARVPLSLQRSFWTAMQNIKLAHVDVMGLPQDGGEECADECSSLKLRLFELSDQIRDLKERGDSLSIAKRESEIHEPDPHTRKATAG